ncbi:hypothetical protein ACH4CD_00240 [Streptomyces fungicidicus]|uniref:hypothetical protein n=1 Tax=Streptomyces fungicidicus TaxID=68203 RepID=UPI0037AC9ED0
MFALVGTALILGAVCVLFFIVMSLWIGCGPFGLFRKPDVKLPGGTTRWEFDNRPWPRDSRASDGAGGDFGRDDSSSWGDGGGD